MITAVFNFLMIAGAIQGFIFNIATFLSRKKIEKPILFLNLLVFFLSLNNLQSWFIEKRFLSDVISFHDFTVPWYVLIAPMFYAFLVYYLEIQEKRFPVIIISLLIFFIELLARTVITYMVNIGSWPDTYLVNYSNTEDFVTLCYSLFLYFKAIKIVFKSKKMDTPIMAYDDLQWLKWFFYLGGVVFFLWMVSIFFNLTELVQKPYSYYPLRLGSSLLIYWIGYQGFFRYVVLKDRILLRKEIRNSQDQPILKTSDKDERGELAFSEIDKFILKNQKFLDPQLSLENLSDELGKSTSHLSKLMNTHAGSNFPDYINKYRVTEAKKLLADDNFNAYTIISIGLECGFNSKSTFYTAFKKFTGQTPTAYRKSTS